METIAQWLFSDGVCSCGTGSRARPLHRPAAAVLAPSRIQRVTLLSGSDDEGHSVTKTRRHCQLSSRAALLWLERSSAGCPDAGAGYWVRSATWASPMLSLPLTRAVHERTGPPWPRRRGPGAATSGHASERIRSERLEEVEHGLGSLTPQVVVAIVEAVCERIARVASGVFGAHLIEARG